MLGDEVGEGVHNEAAPLPEFLGPDSQLPDPVAPLGFELVAKRTGLGRTEEAHVLRRRKSHGRGFLRAQPSLVSEDLDDSRFARATVFPG